MSLPLSNVTRTAVSLARKSALLAHVSSPVPAATHVNAQHTRALTSSGAKPSVSSLSSATFLGASLAARKLVAANGERKSLQEDPSAEVHGYLKAILQSKQRAMDAEMANEPKEEYDPAAY